MRRAAVAAALMVAGACGGNTAHVASSDERARPTSPTAAARAVREARSARGYETVAAPQRVQAPAIALDVRDLLPLGRAPDGTLAVPPFGRAGWWAEGPKPGQRGPAVIVGHVDSRDGPDVFYRLHELRAGDVVFVERADGSSVRFTVERVERFPKDAFPSDAVYAPNLDVELRLVTCGGAFDYSSGHYRDNVVVFATATG